MTAKKQPALSREQAIRIALGMNEVQAPGDNSRRFDHMIADTLSNRGSSLAAIVEGLRAGRANYNIERQKEQLRQAERTAARIQELDEYRQRLGL